MKEKIITEHNIELLALDYLWLSIPIILLALLGLKFYKSRLATRKTLNYNFFVDLPLLIIIPLAVTSLLWLALLRPSIGRTVYEMPVQSGSLFILFDVSDSMLAKDLPPNRLVFAKRKLLDLLDYLALQEQRIRISIIPFAGDNSVFCPLTADYQVLKMYIEALEPDLFSKKGSDLNSAIRTADSTAQKLGLTSATTLIISDGEAHKSFSNFTKPKNRTHVFAVGTETGAPIETTSGALLKDSTGNIVVSKRQDALLKSIAEVGLGNFYELKIGTNTVESFYKLLVSQAEKSLEQQKAQMTQYNEIGYLALWLLLAVLLITYLIPLRAGLLLLPILLLFTPLHSYSQQEDKVKNNLQNLSKDELSAETLYQQGRYLEALSHYERQLTSAKSPDPQLLLGRAATNYRLERYEAALKDYQQVAESTNLGRTAFSALYNAGNSALKGNKPEDAIKFYDKALQIKPEDKATLFNKELAKKLLEQQQEQQEQQPEESDSSEEPSEDESKSKEDQQNSDTEDSDNKQDPENEPQQEQKDQDKEQNSSSESEEEDEKSSNSEQNENEDQKESEKDQTKESEDTTDEDQKQSEDQGENQDKNIDSTESDSKDEQISLEQIAAQRWLDSLPEAPLLVPQFGSSKDKDSGGETW